MDKLSERVEALTPEQRALLEARKKKRLAFEASREPGESQPGAIGQSAAESESLSERRVRVGREMKFSLYFFSDDGSSSRPDKYALMLECAKFADQNGFTAVWVPERHFQRFGGLHPNPSVIAAALAAITNRIQIRAGSVALPLHHPARVAEEWAIVDNLSGGRVGISFASGWHPDDFIFAPSAYERRKEIMFDHIRKITNLWAGDEVAFEAPNGSTLPVRILPKPIQSTLPVWITTAGSASTWARAGEIGANIFCALVGSSFEEMAERIALYRKARAEGGHKADSGQVTVMLHTYVGPDEDAVRAMVRAPMCNYLRSYFQQFENVVEESASITEDDKLAIVSRAFEQYYDTSLLIGTPGKCQALIDHLADIGVDEIACLVDFGLEFDVVTEGLGRLLTLKQQFDWATPQQSLAAPAQGD